MKFFAIIASLLLMSSCAHFSDNSSTVDINGTWKGEMKSGFGGKPMQFTFNFIQVNDSVTGTVNGMPGQWIPLENVEHKGKNISFSVTSEMYGMKSVIKYKGEINGEKIKMSFKNENPGGFGASKGPRNVDTRSIGGSGMGGGMGMGGGFGMGAPTSSNNFTIERVSKVPIQ
jgi:hypothetical protein